MSGANEMEIVLTARLINGRFWPINAILASWPYWYTFLRQLSTFFSPNLTTSTTRQIPEALPKKIHRQRKHFRFHVIAVRTWPELSEKIILHSD